MVFRNTLCITIALTLTTWSACAAEHKPCTQKPTAALQLKDNKGQPLQPPATTAHNAQQEHRRRQEQQDQWQAKIIAAALWKI